MTMLPSFYSSCLFLDLHSLYCASPSLFLLLFLIVMLELLLFLLFLPLPLLQLLLHSSQPTTNILMHMHSAQWSHAHIHTRG